MPNYVCTQLSSPNALTGVRTCETWIEYVPPSFLPPLTIDEANQILYQAFIILAAIWIAKRAFRLLAR